MDLRKKLEQRNGDAQRWSPTAGDILIGKVKEMRKVTTGYGEGRVVDIENKEGTFTVFLSTVLRSKFSKQDIKPGDEVGIKFLGEVESKGGRSYKDFAVVTEEDSSGETQSTKKKDPISIDGE